MTDNEQLTFADIQNLQELLKEYTNKLRNVCQIKAQGDFRQFFIFSVTSATALITITFYIIFFLQQNAAYPRYILPSIATLIFIVFIFGLLFSVVYRNRNIRFSFDADQVATSLIRLIKLSSQYNEHARNLISKKFEFDLRLSEAEATLRFYYKIFEKEPPMNEEVKWILSNKHKEDWIA